MSGKYSFHPVTAQRWADLERLFGPRGACGGCWCMLWRRSHAEYERNKGEGNRRALRKLVAAGAPAGILAYRDGKAAGWCSVAPRSSFPGLVNSRILSPVDDQPVWSVTCLFVAREARRTGLSVELLKAAAEFARQQGALLLEGYPQEPRTGEMPPAFAWTGLAAAFRKARFTEVARRSPTRPIMRRRLRPARARSQRASQKS